MPYARAVCAMPCFSHVCRTASLMPESLKHVVAVHPAMHAPPRSYAVYAYFLSDTHSEASRGVGVARVLCAMLALASSARFGTNDAPVGCVNGCGGRCRAHGRRRMVAIDAVCETQCGTRRRTPRCRRSRCVLRLPCVPLMSHALNVSLGPSLASSPRFRHKRCTSWMSTG